MAHPATTPTMTPAFALRFRALALVCARLSGFLGIGLAAASPVLGPRRSPSNSAAAAESDEDLDDDPAALWVLYIISMALVLLGGAFAGLTIALMGQDETYLRVMALDPEEPQRKNAKRVHDLLTKGKHWVLVTLLLSNVIVNETLPVVLDRCFGGGVAAVVGSTVLIVIFGEVLPQSVCVRYGLQIGGYMSRPVVFLMYLMAPLAWPTAKLLDWLLGEDHGTTYKKSGLKTLVTLHKSLGEIDERLNQDEVTIISAVLDLKRKPVVEVMTPMDDVFVMSEDTVLDEKTIDQILDAGYSRIPIHRAGNPTNFIGMLLVKILITYDPEDGRRVRDFALATLPETRPETSCLDIINFFQEGKSHMVLISESPGENQGALGVVTLEDVIEELIGEEIIDESDVYVDVHKAIRRATPAPKARVQRRDLLAKDAAAKHAAALAAAAAAEDEDAPQSRLSASLGRNETLSSSPKLTTLLMRRSSAGQDGQAVRTTVPVKANYEEMRDHLKHLGPSNPASHPKSTKVSAVKIKPGSTAAEERQQRSDSVVTAIADQDMDDDADEHTSLLKPQLTAKDGVQALQQTYGGVSASDSKPPTTEAQATMASITEQPTSQVTGVTDGKSGDTSPIDSNGPGTPNTRRQPSYVRSGSITENVVEADGIRKVILEMSNSSDSDQGPPSSTAEATSTSESASQAHGQGDSSGQGGNGKKKNKRKNKNKK